MVQLLEHYTAKAGDGAFSCHGWCQGALAPAFAGDRERCGRAPTCVSAGATQGSSIRLPPVVALGVDDSACPCHPGGGGGGIAVPRMLPQAGCRANLVVAHVVAWDPLRLDSPLQKLLPHAA